MPRGRSCPGCFVGISTYREELLCLKPGAASLHRLRGTKDPGAASTEQLAKYSCYARSGPASTILVESQ